MPWALIGAALGLIFVALSDITDPAWFVAMLTVFAGLFGLFFHHRDRLDEHEDGALEKAARDPASTEKAAEWIRRLRSGQRVKVGAFATLTSDGIEWTGLRKSSIRWAEVEYVTPWTMSVQGGIRAVRHVRLRVKQKTPVVNCSKRNFADVLATCAEMARTSS